MNTTSNNNNPDELVKLNSDIVQHVVDDYLDRRLSQYDRLFKVQQLDIRFNYDFKPYQVVLVTDVRNGRTSQWIKRDELWIEQ